VPDAACVEPVRGLVGELLGYAAAFGCGAPLASPSSVMVGTVMTGPAASCFSRSSYFALGQPAAPAVVMDHETDMIRVVNAFAVRSNVASSKRHCGDAICQMSLAKSYRYLS
jgi:hypothetical protein